jgi:hypothetical protein
MSKSPPEAAFIPKAVYQKGLKRVFRYSGLSMQPTFRTGQVLYVRPDVQAVKPGDVVVYKQEGRYIVHRVLSVGMDGYVTRGDNNPQADANPVAPGQVIGRVDMDEHRGEIRSVWGGRSGLWLTRLGRAARWLKPGLRLVFGWPYRRLKASRFMVRIWKPAISQIHLKSDSGMLVKYIYRKKTVAVWEASLGRFECRKPFDLVIPSPLEETKPL